MKFSFLVIATIIFVLDSGLVQGEFRGMTTLRQPYNEHRVLRAKGGGMMCSRIKQETKCEANVKCVFDADNGCSKKKNCGTNCGKCDGAETDCEDADDCIYNTGDGTCSVRCRRLKGETACEANVKCVFNADNGCMKKKDCSKKCHICGDQATNCDKTTECEYDSKNAKCRTKPCDDFTGKPTDCDDAFDCVYNTGDGTCSTMKDFLAKCMAPSAYKCEYDPSEDKCSKKD